MEKSFDSNSVRKTEIIQLLSAYLNNRKDISVVRKIGSIVNSSAFQARILSEVIIMILQKCIRILKLVQKGSDDDNSASGYFKWIVNSDHLAHESIYEIPSKDQESEDSFGAAQSLGDVYKGISSFVKNDVLSEDYIRTLITRYNDDKSETNQNKLESICFKNHHLVFYHLMDLLRLIEYLSFKTPSLSTLFHFLNDKELLMKLKDIYVTIFEVIGNQTYLDFYIKILDEIEKRIKKTKETTETWSEWFVSSIYQDEKGKYQKQGNIEDDDSQICSNNDQREEQLDDEDMYIVFTSTVIFLILK